MLNLYQLALGHAKVEQLWQSPVCVICYLRVYSVGSAFTSAKQRIRDAYLEVIGGSWGRPPGEALPRQVCQHDHC